MKARATKAAARVAASSCSRATSAQPSAADRALVGVSAYDPDLDPWRFNISPAYGGERVPAAGALFTERGIYRPGDVLYAKAIVRNGSLGALTVPARADSMRWLFTTRDGGTMLDSVVALSAFGTADVSIHIPTNAAIGTYPVQIQTKRGAQWLPVGDASYRVAEYRAPEFLVDLTSTDATRFPGDSMRATVQARYLFGAPMGRAAVTWQAWQSPAYVTDDIKGAEGYFIGDNGWWWEDEEQLSGEQRAAVRERHRHARRIGRAHIERRAASSRRRGARCACRSRRTCRT